MESVSEPQAGPPLIVTPHGETVSVEGVVPVEPSSEGTVTAFVHQPAKVMRVAAMIRQLLEEVRTSPLDEAARARLREIHARSLAELEDGLSPDLVSELERLSLPFTEDDIPSEAELRIAQAQLVGWLEGLFHGIQTALFAQQMAARAQFEEMRRRATAPPGILPPAVPGAAPEGTERGSHGLYL
ncbi:MAG: bacterial proteasome activator family protein [bacterium]